MNHRANTIRGVLLAGVCVAVGVATSALLTAGGSPESSRAIRPFYNRAVPEFTFRQNTSTNPLGAAITHPRIAERAEYRPQDFGAVLNVADITREQAIANRAALQTLIDAMPDTGGVVLIDGLLQIFGGVEAPMRVFPPQSQPRAIPFAIVGTTPGATLVNLEASPAVTLRTGGVTSFQEPSTRALRALRNLAIASKGKGVVVQGGGKEITLDGVTLFGCEDDALTVEDWDGGLMRGVYALNNRKDGAVFNRCHQCDIQLTTRGNLGRGAVLTASNSLSLWLYAEANGGYGLDATDCKLINATLWQEANNGSVNAQTGAAASQNTPQGRLVRSQLHVTGIAAQDRNLAFDADAYSRLATTFAGRIATDKLAAYRVDLPWPPVLAGVRPQRHPILDVAEVSGVVTLTTRPGAYTAQPLPITSNWLELYPQASTPPMRRVIRTGDTLITRVHVTPDAECVKFFRAFTTQRPTRNVPAFQVAVSHGSQTDSQLVYFASPGAATVEVVSQHTTADSGYLRVFVYVGPVKLPAVEGESKLSPDFDGEGNFTVTAEKTTIDQPAESHSLAVRGVELYHVPAL